MIDHRPRHRPMAAWVVLRRMAGKFRPYRWHVLGSLLLVLVSAAVTVAFPILLLKRVIDVALPARDAKQLFVLCGLMVAAGVIASAAAIAETALTNWVGQRVSADLRVELYDRVQAQPIQFHGKHGETQIQARMVSDLGGVDRFLTNTVQTVVYAAITLGATAVAMLLMSWPFALASAALTLPLAYLNRRFAERRRRLAQHRQQLVTEVLQRVSEDLSVGGVTLGRTLGCSGVQRSGFVAVCRQLRDTTLRQRNTGAFAHVVIASTFACVPPLILLGAGTVVSDLSVGAAVALVVLQIRLAAPIQSLLRLSASLYASVAMFERIIEYLDLEPDHDQASPVGPTTATGPATVRVRGVAFRYGGSRHAALADVNLDIPAGSVTIVIGHSGSGKSTLGLVLAGLLKPHIGTVEVPGTRLEGLCDLRAIATLVPQEPTIFSTTIRRNLTFAREDATPAEIEQAIAVVCLEELVASLPKGYDTVVGRNGYLLSGGERQRLVLARALLSPSRILVVDEVTSALDQAMASRVHAQLRAYCRERTLVVITHHVPPLAPEDQVVVIDRGRVVDHGPHAEVAARTDGYQAVTASSALPISTSMLRPGAPTDALPALSNGRSRL